MTDDERPIQRAKRSSYADDSFPVGWRYVVTERLSAFDVARPWLVDHSDRTMTPALTP